MKQALGLVEIAGLSTAVVVADAMAKAANVQILEVENTKGLGYMTIKVTGDVGAVNASVQAGCQLGRMHDKLVSYKVIPRPSDFVEQTFCTPAMAEEPVKAEAAAERAEPETVREPEETTEPETVRQPEETAPAAETAESVQIVLEPPVPEVPEKQASEQPTEAAAPVKTAGTTPDAPKPRTTRSTRRKK